RKRHHHGRDRGWLGVTGLMHCENLGRCRRRPFRPGNSEKQFSNPTTPPPGRQFDDRIRAMTGERPSPRIAPEEWGKPLSMRRAFLKPAFAALLTLLAAAPSFAASERKTVAASAPRLALVIGNANYARLGTLGNPGRDAHLMAEKLAQLGFDVT